MFLKLLAVLCAVLVGVVTYWAMAYGQNIGTHYFRKIYGLSLTLSSS